MRPASALCGICGAELSDTRERFCGGNRCSQVFDACWAGSSADSTPVRILSVYRATSRRGETASSEWLRGPFRGHEA